jgi:hypothetical protein
MDSDIDKHQISDEIKAELQSQLEAFQGNLLSNLDEKSHKAFGKAGGIGKGSFQ